MSRVKLILIEPAGEVTKTFAGQDEITVGRSKTTDLPIQAGVSSRLHCRLRRGDQGMMIEDLGSRNGTMLNGYRVTKPTPLTVGDKIEIGDSVIFYQRRGGSGPLEDSSGEATPVALKAVGSGRSPAQPKVAPSFKLSCIAGGEKGRSFHIQDQLRLGRRRANDIVLNDEEASGKHAKVFRKGRTLYLFDLKSTNGTWVGGKRISRRQMHDGEVFTIGSHSFKIIATLPDGSRVADDDDSDDELLALDANAAAQAAERAAQAQEDDDVLEEVEFVDDDDDDEAEAGEVTPLSRQQPAVPEDGPRPGAERVLARANLVSVISAIVAVALGIGTLIYAGIFIATAAESRSVEPPLEGNLIANWSFETVVDDAPDAWTLEGDAGIDRNRPAAGFVSLRLGAEGRARSQSFSVEPGRSYRLTSLWKLRDAGPVLVSVHWLNSDGRPHDLPACLEPIDGNRSYRSSGMLVEAPEGAASAVLELYNHRGEAWCDRISLRRPDEEEPEGAEPPQVSVGPMRAALGQAGVPALMLRERPFIAGLELTLGQEAEPLGLQSRSRAAGESKVPAPGQVLVSRQLFNAVTGRWIRMRYETEVRGEQLVFTYGVPHGDLNGLPALGLRLQLGSIAFVSGLLYQDREVQAAEGVAIDELQLEESGYQLAVSFDQPMRYYAGNGELGLLLDPSVLGLEHGSELTFEVRFGTALRGQASDVESIIAEARRLHQSGLLGQAYDQAVRAAGQARESARIKKAQALKNELGEALSAVTSEIRTLGQTLTLLADPRVAELVKVRADQLERLVAPRPDPLRELTKLRGQADRVIANAGADASERRANQLIETAKVYFERRRYALCIATLEEMLAIAPEHPRAKSARELLEAAESELQSVLEERLEGSD